MAYRILRSNITPQTLSEADPETVSTHFR
jgi:hypothetical protein